MKWSSIIFIMVVMTLLTCCTQTAPTPQGPAAGKLGQAIDANVADRKNLQAKQDGNDSYVLANLKGAQKMNALQPPAPATAAVAIDVSSAIEAMEARGVVVLPGDEQAVAAEDELILEGKLAEAMKEIDQRRAQQMQAAQEIKTAKDTIAQRDQAITDLQAKAQQQSLQAQADFKRQLAEANQRAEDKLNRVIILGAAALGLLLLTGGITILFSFPLAKNVGVGMAVSGAFILASIRVINSPAFPWVAGGAGLIALVSIVLFFRHTHQTQAIEARLRRVVQGVNDEAQTAPEKVGPVWDEIKGHLDYWFPHTKNGVNSLASVIADRNAKEGINAN